MKFPKEEYKKIWNSEFGWSVFLGVFFLFLSMIANYWAGIYASERVSTPVTDIILNNVPVFDVDGIVIYGALFLILFALIVTIFHPKKIPFVLKSMALFVVIRSIFISLTHLGPFSPQVPVASFYLFRLIGLGSAADLFFSGHTGTPFLLAMIYWNNKILRLIFLAFCGIFAISVLVGHMHYSIDVFAAFFISYTIFVIAQKFFAKDWQTANREIT